MSTKVFKIINTINNIINTIIKGFVPFCYLLCKQLYNFPFFTVLHQIYYVILKRNTYAMADFFVYIYVIQNSILGSVFVEASRRRFYLKPQTNIVNVYKSLTNYIFKPSLRTTLSIGKNIRKISAVVFKFVANKHTDGRRRSLFYNIILIICSDSDIKKKAT